MKRAPKNVVQSVLARLRKVADTSGLGFNDALQMYVNERFLARLARTKHAKTVLLKGALMLRVWGIPRARANAQDRVRVREPRSCKRAAL